MNGNIPEIFNLIQDLSWYFGNQGFDGECCEDLSLVEYMALKRVCVIKDITIQQIRIELNITKSGVSKIIDRLEKKEYVLREQSSNDGRVCCVVPTEKGSNAVYNIANRYSEYLVEVLDEVEPESIDNIKKALELLLEAIKKKGFIKSN